MVNSKLTRRKFIFSVFSAATGGFMLGKTASGFVQKSAFDEIIKPGTRLEKLAGGFIFTEGPASDAEGNVYFTDQPNDRIMIWSLSEKLSVFMTPSGRANGLAFDSQGNLWACADEKNELWCIAPDKTVSVIPSMFLGKPLNGPNDLWITSEGGIYFTDPFFKRTWWDHDTMPQPLQGVYYLKPDHKTIIRVIDDLVMPNGITGSQDGNSLFVADLGANKTWSYTIINDGVLINKKLFCDKGSDGMTTDLNGNIYLSGNGISIFDKSGKFVGNIPVPEEWTGNVCFGGSDMKSLFITASKGFYRIRTNIKGTC
jgi:gluconolactonase